jgi:Domain of unknown function (DUF4345)
VGARVVAGTVGGSHPRRQANSSADFGGLCRCTARHDGNKPVMRPSMPDDGGRRELQYTLGVLATIPFTTGLVDIVAGSDLLPGGSNEITASLDSEFRFASTFWCAVGPVIWSQLRRVDADSPVLPLTMATVFLGGLARSRSWAVRGRPHAVFIGATALELIGMPVVFTWHRHVVNRSRVAQLSAGSVRAPVRSRTGSSPSAAAIA